MCMNVLLAGMCTTCMLVPVEVRIGCWIPGTGDEDGPNLAPL